MCVSWHLFCFFAFVWMLRAILLLVSWLVDRWSHLYFQVWNLRFNKKCVCVLSMLKYCSLFLRTACVSELGIIFFSFIYILAPKAEEKKNLTSHFNMNAKINMIKCKFHCFEMASVIWLFIHCTHNGAIEDYLQQ